MKVGVIGAGVMGSLHSRVYYEIPGVELVGVVDKDLKKAKDVALRYGALAFDSAEKLIGKVDAVTVAVPTCSHRDVANLFLKNGVDVLVEKPMAFDLKEAEDMIKTARANKRILMVGHIERFNPTIGALKNIIKNEKIQEIETRRRNPFVSRIEDCGIVLDLMVHDIDVVRYLTGERPVVDYVIGGSVKSKHEDWAKVVMKYGKIPTVHLSDRRTQKKIRKIEVNCEDKLIDADYVNQEIKIYSQAKPVYNGRPFFSEKIETIVARGEPLKLELLEFIDAVKNRREPSVTGEEGKKNLEVISDIMKKMKVKE
ncbi:MAG: Gfo/Idh/MocA family oxidoreductase [archaeon]|nr:MAG: Gfo/Idh/MocA family oxidoreductase [archaeon]